MSTALISFMRESLLWITNQRLVKPAGGFPRSLAPGSSPVYNLTMTGPIVCERQRYKFKAQAYQMESASTIATSL